MKSPWSAGHNVYNILAAICMGVSYGFDAAYCNSRVAQNAARCRGDSSVSEIRAAVSGGCGLRAHRRRAAEPDRGSARLKPRRVITLFGCGGDRDRAKRPLMGRPLGKTATLSFSPRTTRARRIRWRLFMTPWLACAAIDARTSRGSGSAKGIRIAIRQAVPGDIVIIAGKGHEPYQVLRDQTIDFDDRVVAAEVLRELGFGG